MANEEFSLGFTTEEIAVWNELSEGSITSPTTIFSDVVSLKNITPPTSLYADIVSLKNITPPVSLFADVTILKNITSPVQIEVDSICQVNVLKAGGEPDSIASAGGPGSVMSCP